MAELTTTEAFQFLETVLHIESPMDKLKADRVAFLGELIRTFLHTMPFQSLTLVATPDEEKHVLIFEEIKGNMFARRGGLCFEMNYFMKVLLVVLGYEAYSIVADIINPKDHVGIIVKNLTADTSLHLVEVGMGHPILFPIPLDFEQESPVYNSSFLTYKFVRSDKGTIWLMVSPHEFSKCTADQLVDGWLPFEEFTTELAGLQRLSTNMAMIYTATKPPRKSFSFATSPRAMDFRHDRLVAIKDKSLLLEDSTGKVTNTKLSNREEWLKAYAEHFPHISRDLLEKVLKNIDLFGNK